MPIILSIDLTYGSVSIIGSIVVGCHVLFGHLTDPKTFKWKSLPFIRSGQRCRGERHGDAIRFTPARRRAFPLYVRLRPHLRTTTPSSLHVCEYMFIYNETKRNETNERTNERTNEGTSMNTHVEQRLIENLYHPVWYSFISRLCIIHRVSIRITYVHNFARIHAPWPYTVKNIIFSAITPDRVVTPRDIRRDFSRPIETSLIEIGFRRNRERGRWFR